MVDIGIESSVETTAGTTQLGPHSIRLGVLGICAKVKNVIFKFSLF